MPPNRPDPAQIAHLEGQGNYTFCRRHAKEKSPYLRPYTLKLCLAEYPGFVRVHKRHAVNPSCVVSIDRDLKELTLATSTGPVRLPVGRTHWKAVEARFGT